MTRIAFWRNGQGFGVGQNFTMSKDQRVDDGQLETDHVKLNYRDSTDDEEVRLLPHRRGMVEPDPPGSDFRDGPNTSDTQ